ncbi:aldo/keto reductase family protein [Methylomonas koyamae]|uniref:aldo/keto reductase family protein n=1 Tax=Methylomonas koyamae TaxID=702114 RepID=UPI00112CEE4D|nr:aldo/keto reductase [Methylomonas koyamae]TPQ25605.1 aldo/keto reductase [Methylomonas koyamae]
MPDHAFVVSAADVRIPGILYGTAWKQERTAELVTQAIAAGFRGIDTACQPKHYDEAGVGAGIAAACAKSGLARAELYLQTKFTPLNGHDPLRIPYNPRAGLAEQVAQSFAVSQRNLQTDYLDGLVLHSPLADRKQLLEVWQAMEALAGAGKVKQLGISNCYDFALFEYLYQTAEIKPAVVQNRFYADTGYDKQIRAFCRQRQIVYQSFWTLTANPRVLAHPAVTAAAGARGRTPAQIFFRYLHQHGVVPLTGTCSAAHMGEDLAIFEFTLDADECAAISALF